MSRQPYQLQVFNLQHRASSFLGICIKVGLEQDIGLQCAWDKKFVALQLCFLWFLLPSPYSLCLSFMLAFINVKGKGKVDFPEDFTRLRCFRAQCIVPALCQYVFACIAIHIGKTDTLNCSSYLARKCRSPQKIFKKNKERKKREQPRQPQVKQEHRQDL